MKFRKSTLISFLIILINLPLTACIDLGDLKYNQNQPNLQTIPGIEFQTQIIPHPNPNIKTNLEIHIFKIDPTKIRLKIHTIKDKTQPKSIQTIHQQQKSLLTFNGIFFDENFKPLGLLISDNQEISPYRQSQLSNGIFTIQTNTTPKLLTSQPTQIQKQSINFAIQNGPILIDESGEIKFNTETEKYAARTAIGITKDQNILLIFIPQSLSKLNNEITLYQLTQLLKHHPIFQPYNLNSVLNLDGGVSTGYQFQTIYEPELNYVQNIIYTESITNTNE